MSDDASVILATMVRLEDKTDHVRHEMRQRLGQIERRLTAIRDHIGLAPPPGTPPSVVWELPVDPRASLNPECMEAAERLTRSYSASCDGDRLTYEEAEYQARELIANAASSGFWEHLPERLLALRMRSRFMEE